MLFSWNTIILYLHTTFGGKSSSLDCKTEDPKAGEKQLSTVKPGTARVTVCLVQMYVLFSCFAIWFAIPTLAISL